MTNKINGGKGFGPIDNITRARKPNEAKNKPGGGSVDRVEFSSVLKDVNKIRQTAETTSPERQAKLQALREQIAEGNYRPDTEKVAASLLKFLGREE